MTKFEAIVIETKREFPHFHLIVKDDSKFMKFLFTIALMRFWCPDYMKSYTTVMSSPLGHAWVFMPLYLIGTDSGWGVMRHERVHMRDSRGFFKWFWFVFTYAMLPIGPSGRAYWEFKGYKESMQVLFEQYGNVTEANVDWFAKHFTDSSYLFMFPFKKTIRKLFMKAREEIIANG